MKGGNRTRRVRHGHPIMSTHALKLPQSSCQSEVNATVRFFLPDQDRFYTHTDKSRFQNVSDQEKLRNGPSARHIQNDTGFEARAAAASPALKITGQQKSSRDLQIKQIILLRSREDSSRTSEEFRESSRFTSTVSISLHPRRNAQDTADEKATQAATHLYSALEEVNNTANQQNTELTDAFSSTKQCGESAGESFKDGSNADLGEDGSTTLQQLGHYPPKQGKNTGLQLNLHEQAQIVNKNTKRLSNICDVQAVGVCPENAPRTQQYPSSLTSNGADCDNLKASTDSQGFAHQVLSLASAPESENISDLVNPSSTMLTSALATVLAPPWSGHLRKPKQGLPPEVDPQDLGQNISPPGSSHQDRHQQPFLPSARLPIDTNIQLTAGTSYNPPDWQKENSSPNITTTSQPRKSNIKSFSVDTEYNNAEFNIFSSSLDTRQELHSSHSGSIKTGDEHGPFKSSSSKPTTSSLLLSLRRSNLRSSSAERTQTESRSVRSLTLPSRTVLKRQSFAESADNQTPKYPDNPTTMECHKEGIPVSQFPFSPRIKSRVPLRTSLFLNKPDTDISKCLQDSLVSAEEECFSHSTTKTDQLGVLKAQHNSYLVLLKEYYCTQDVGLVDQRNSNNTNLKNSNITKPQVGPEATVSNISSFQQSDIKAKIFQSQSTQDETVSSSSAKLHFIPSKASPIVGTSPSNVRQVYLDSKKHSQSSQSSMDLASPDSPSRPQLRSNPILLRKYSSTEDPNPEEQRTANNTNLQVTPETTVSNKSITDFGVNVQSVESQNAQNVRVNSSSHTRSFTDKFKYLPRKDSVVDGMNPSNIRQMYLDLKKHSQSSQSSMDLSSPLSPSRPQQSSYSPLLRKHSSMEDIDLVEQRTANNKNLLNSNITQQLIAPEITGVNKTSANLNVQQTGINVQNVQTQRSQNATVSNSSGTSTFTDKLNHLPRKDSSVNEISPTNIRQMYLDSKKHSQSSQSSMDLSSPLSPSRPLRSVRVPSIYSYLRESSPAMSTPSPSAPSSHIQRVETSPSKHDGSLQDDLKTVPSRFTFDSPFVPQVNTFQRSSNGSSTQAPAQSLPPDFGSILAPRLSTSPYSSLISSRPALNNTLQGLSSPPVSKTHVRSTSYDVSTTRANVIRGEPNSSLSTYTGISRRPEKQLASPNREQRPAVQAHTSALDNHRPAQPCLFQTAPDASFVKESRSSNISTHPKSSNTGSNNIHNGLMAIQPEKGNAYPKHRLNEKEKYMLAAESEIPPIAEKVNVHRSLQETQTSSPKKGIFASRVKRDISFSSASLPDKEVVSSQYLKTKRHSPVLKTNSRLDQILNRLRLTFSVKRSDGILDTITKKNKTHTQQNSDDAQTFGKPITEDDANSGSQQEPYLTTNKTSLGSLSPSTLKISEKALNMQKGSKADIKYSECVWEVPKSSLNTDEPYVASFGSLSPLTLRKSANNQPKRHSDENGHQSHDRSVSPHMLKVQSMNRSATLPHYRKSSPPSPFNLFDFDSEDNDNVFYSPVSKKTNSLCASDDFSPLSSTKNGEKQNLLRSRLSSSCADLKYGLQGGRSFSVSSVVSSRPSGPGRISTSSISDLSSLDDFVQKGNNTVVDSSVSRSLSPSNDAKSVTGKQSECVFSDDYLDRDNADPTPPPSPTLSSSPRRMSQASSPLRTTPENTSPPRGILSRGYTASWTVFEESGSDTTTDDEYYLDNDNEVETEL